MIYQRLFSIFAATAVTLGVSASKPSDVLMTVDGVPVTVSEFEYLYNKNNTQQAEPQSVDSYLGMFINYKLKVADAVHNGIDQTPEFINEYNTFVHDLAKPYFRDESVKEDLVKEAYSHFNRDVAVSHIMLPLTAGNEQMLDSLRNEIVGGKITFEEAAAKYSMDKYSAANGGKMGLVTPMRFPWPFEKMAYETKEGDISPVVNSTMGYHIIRIDSNTPAKGQVFARHILLMTRGLDAKTAQEKKNTIDSLYVVLKQGGDFAQLATKYSEDHGSAKKGGELPWFSPGQMVQPFDSISFSIADGVISEPFATPYGYHIVQRLAHRGVQPLDSIRPEIEERIATDARSTLPRKAVFDRLLAKYNANIDSKTTEAVAYALKENKSIVDSTLLASLSAKGLVAATCTGFELPLADVLQNVPENCIDLVGFVSEQASAALESFIEDQEIDRLKKENADFGNLLAEYHDGILLYEISNRNVWDKAAKDTAGLEEYFQKNATKYKWDTPRFKGYVIFATSDSVLTEALDYAQEISPMPHTDFVSQMRKKFGRDIKIDRVIAAKGENAITDYLGFGAERPADKPNNRFTFYSAFQGRVIDQPEEATDVRGKALTDYQSYLDAVWIAELHKKYKVKLDKKILKSIK